MTSPVLRTSSLTIGYRADRPLARAHVVAADVNLTLAAGELVCLLGPNGAGKSTLLRTLAGMQPALAGQVVLGGDDLAGLSSRQLATRLSVVLTDRPNLGLLNGYALVALGRHPHTGWTGRLSRYDEAMVRWAVEAVHAGELAAHPVMELSDGQRQKLMIARALAQDAALIILDEPTAYLDLPRRAEMMSLLRHLATSTGRAILLSTHDLDLALRTADRLWLMADGRVSMGTPEDLVLSGAFEAAFAGEGVVFDRATGAFHLGDEPGRRVWLAGEGVPLMWTQRALRRAGLTPVMPDPQADAPCPHITITGDDAAPVWLVHHAGETVTCGSIAELLALLETLTA